MGLDPEERVRFRNLLSELSGERIVLLSTHIVSDVEASRPPSRIIDQRPAADARRRPRLCWRPERPRLGMGPCPADALPAARQRHLVTGTARRRDGVRARVVAETAPGAGARPAAPSLEDAYLAWIARGRWEDAAAAAAGPAAPAAAR